MDSLITRTQEAREKAFRAIGRLGEGVLSPLLPLEMLPVPVWPAGKPRFRIIERASTTAIVSDGLSDPFDKELHEIRSDFGLGFEFIIETSDAITINQTGDDQTGNALVQGWLYHIIWAASAFAMQFKDIIGMQEQFGLFTIAIEPNEALKPLAGKSGEVGLLVGQSAPSLPQTLKLPSQETLLLPIKLLTGDEFDYALSRGNRGPMTLAHLFMGQGSYHLSSIGRESVLEARPKDEITIEILYFGAPRAGKASNVRYIQKTMFPNRQCDYHEGVRSFTFEPPGMGSLGGKSILIKLVAFSDQEVSWTSPAVGDVMAQVDGIVFVVDSAPTSESLNREALERLRRRLADSGRQLAEIPMVLQYNKRDLPNALAPDLIGESLSTGNLPSFEAVATEGLGVFAALKEITRLCVGKLQAMV